MTGPFRRAAPPRERCLDRAAVSPDPRPPASSPTRKAAVCAGREFLPPWSTRSRTQLDPGRCCSSRRPTRSSSLTAPNRAAPRCPFGTPGVTPTDRGNGCLSARGICSTRAPPTGRSAPPLARLAPAASRRAAVSAPSARLPVLVRSSHDAPPTLPSRAAPLGQTRSRLRRLLQCPRGQECGCGRASRDAPPSRQTRASLRRRPSRCRDHRPRVARSQESGAGATGSCPTDPKTRKVRMRV